MNDKKLSTCSCGSGEKAWFVTLIMPDCGQPPSRAVCVNCFERVEEEMWRPGTWGSVDSPKPLTLDQYMAVYKELALSQEAHKEGRVADGWIAVGGENE